MKERGKKEKIVVLGIPRARVTIEIGGWWRSHMINSKNYPNAIMMKIICNNSSWQNRNKSNLQCTEAFWVMLINFISNELKFVIIIPYWYRTTALVLCLLVGFYSRSYLKCGNLRTATEFFLWIWGMERNTNKTHPPSVSNFALFWFYLLCNAFCQDMNIPLE